MPSPPTTPLDGGPFATWLSEVQVAIRGDQASAVPCGDCTACCTSSQFIHIGPDETETLARIPASLLFPAPRLPVGHVLMGYDQHGRCPMLVENRCSIYADRPRTCRTYDCRVFPASEIYPSADEGKDLIGRQARRWVFSHPGEDDVVRHRAVAAAAAFIREHVAELPEDIAPRTSTQLAVLAVRVHDLFLEPSTPTVDDVVLRAR